MRGPKLKLFRPIGQSGKDYGGRDFALVAEIHPVPLYLLKSHLLKSHFVHNGSMSDKGPPIANMKILKYIYLSNP